jgi:hypothetical protein
MKMKVPLCYISMKGRQVCKGNHLCISMATLNTFILLTAICSSTTKMEGTVAFPWQRWSCKIATNLLYTYTSTGVAATVCHIRFDVLVAVAMNHSFLGYIVT